MTVGRHTKIYTERSRSEEFYLKQDFIDYLQSIDLAQTTQKSYLINLNLFLKWLGNEEIQTTKKDVLKYLQYLKINRNQTNITRRNSLIAINHYFTFLLQNEQITTNPTALINIRGTKKRTLQRVFTPEELQQLYDNYYHFFVRTYDNSHIPQNQRQHSFLSRNRNAAMLGFLVYQGVTPREAERMLLQDVDFTKATIKIRGGKRGLDRTLPLKATQIGQLMHYVNQIRPQFFSYCAESQRLFFALPPSGKASTNSQHLIPSFATLIKQVKTIDRHFINLGQLRTSVITNWLKTEGLRKAQYLAGHRNINSTEAYKPNQIEGLTEDITQYNPF